jgi:hypothetical protein
MLELEGKLAASELRVLTESLSAGHDLDLQETMPLLSKMEACETAVALLRVQGRRIGLEV